MTIHVGPMLKAEQRISTCGYKEDPEYAWQENIEKCLQQHNFGYEHDRVPFRRKAGVERALAILHALYFIRRKKDKIVKVHEF